MDSGSSSSGVVVLWSRLFAVGLAVAMAALALGCKGSGSQDPPAASGAAVTQGTQGSPSAEPAVDPAILAYAEHQIDLAYAGTDRDPPTTAPKPQKGKNVWIISPGQVGESASVATNAAKEAGEAIGWKMTLFDSKGDPSNFSAGIRQAIAAKADGIILHSIDCAWVKQALVEAQAAKVKTLAYYSLDCDDPSVKGEPLYSGMVNFGSQYGDYASLIRAWGAVKADWVIVKTKGLAKAISFKEDELLVVKYIREGFEQELAKCKTCEVIKTVDFTIPDFGPKLQQKAQGALLQHPEANSIHVPYDTPMLLGIGSAVLESGRNDQLWVIAGEGFPSNVQLIRDNRGEDAANAFPAPWTGFAAVDSLNSIFNGQKPQDAGIGWRLIDRDHNLPPAGKGYESAKDFRTAYKKAWGVLR